MIGARLGHFRITGKLGSGGMGEVYRARDEQLDRDVAVKLLPASSSADPSARPRLLSEARAAAALNHPHICTVYEVGEAADQAYIAMELVEGQPLSALLAGGPLAAEKVQRYGLQLAQALEHAHGRGVVHRDLKSANVVVTPNERVKVLDFGLAKRLSGGELAEATTQSLASLTLPGGLAGTLAYMAPELLLGEAADAHSDIWALGVVLYEMAAGQRPFQGQTGFGVSSAILSQPLRPLPPLVPAELRAVIERCLEKEPRERYQRASEVRAALATVPSGATTSPAPPRRAVARRKRRVRRKQIRALVVLPLANLSRDPEQDYFADGMTEALISDLAKLQALKIISRTSAMRYKGSDKSLPEIADELKVDAVVEGSVLRVGQRVRITAQLIHAATDTHLWAESYDRDLQDVLVMQSEVARAIAQEVKLAVTPEEAKRLVGARPINPEAHEACLRGRFHWYKLTPESLTTALEYFQLALQKDPNCALAYAGMAYVWLTRGETGVPPHEAFRKAKAAALKAIELDDMLAEVHQVLAGVRLAYEWDWVGAEKEFRRALELNPNLAEARFFYGDLLLTLGRSREGLAEIERALELDPLNAFFQCFFGWHLLYLRRDDEAITQLQKMLLREPNSAALHLGLWGAFRRKQMYAEALAEAQKYHALLGYSEVAEALSPGPTQPEYSGAMKLAAERLAARSQQTHVPRIRIARLHAHAGENDQALEWLEKAYAEREGPLSRLSAVWDWDDLRGDPRFQALLGRMKLPQ